MNFKLFALLFILFLFLFSACEQDYWEDSISLNEESTFGIRHDRSLSDYEAAAVNTSLGPNFEAVFAFQYTIGSNTDEEIIASGALIAPQWILTAGHNFFISEEQTTPVNPADINVIVGNDPNNPEAILEVEALYFHPTWLSDNDEVFGKANDLCLLKLKSALTNIKPIALFDHSSEAIGSQVWFSGYGDYSLLEGQNSDRYSKRHAIENILDRKVGGIMSRINNQIYEGGLLAFDFDHPNGGVNTLGDNIVNEDEDLLGPGRSEAVALNLEATTVEGDSGGPLFVKDGEHWKLAGVLSGGATEPIPNHEDSSYGDISIFIRVSSHLDWIRSVMR